MIEYDQTNIFSKILKGAIPSTIVYEDKYVLAFEDVNPQASVHVLLIPKGAYISMTDFLDEATDTEVLALNRAIVKVIRLKGLADGGYRVLTNAGSNGGQEVPHLHLHIIGGQKLGPIMPQ
jgi:histidine triad (HIT) family protein